MLGRERRASSQPLRPQSQNNFFLLLLIFFFFVENQAEVLFQDSWEPRTFTRVVPEDNPSQAAALFAIIW